MYYIFDCGQFVKILRLQHRVRQLCSARKARNASQTLYASVVRNVEVNMGIIKPGECMLVG